MNHHANNQKGFTLVETLVAILILSMTVGALLTLAAGGFFSVRYARNDIVANNLAQEALEYVRNTRDTALAQGFTWYQWKEDQLTADTDGNVTKDLGSGCYSDKGCTVDPYAPDMKIKMCDGDCPAMLFYSSHGFYGYEENYDYVSGNKYETTYVRTVRAREAGSEQLIVTVDVAWLNGASQKTISQSTMLTNWTP